MGFKECSDALESGNEIGTDALQIGRNRFRCIKT